MQLEVNGKKYVENDIINGFQEHFSSLATFNEKTRIDSQYHNLVEEDIQSINKLVQQNNIKNVTSEEITKAIRSINKGKSADYHGITIEHIIYAGSDTEKLLVPLVQCIFKHGSISETLKMGLLTPVFKKQRNKAASYQLQRDYCAASHRKDWIDDGHWRLIKDLHENVKSVVKWEGNISQPSQVNEGVRQGGVLSTNLYKLYINQLLNMYVTTGAGYKIGNISVNSTACADDIALISQDSIQAQILINMSYDYAYMEGYELQPTKSVALNISHEQRKQESNNQTFKMGPNDMPSIEKATHLGIIRTTSLKGNMIANVEENIKIARLSAYRLLGEDSMATTVLT
ncbi:unnamed protein product [Mytilus coruscus]|uniref:Reverse transcriptase domain-containing protein n=1 Tax=Mytilus coruscus TaxID=42192 RepID=A0A6J8DWB6_MYTCO|nr:unnamed protein product [Mytilus coruscus]